MTAQPLRMQTRSVVRSLIARSAVDLFTRQGYEATTLDEVAAAASVSRRTLFNYFGSKEELALSGLTEQGEVIASRIAVLPPGTDPWECLRSGFQALPEVAFLRDGGLDMLRLLFGTEALRAGHAEKTARWQSLLAPLIEAHLPAAADSSFRARALVAAALACLRTAVEEWVRLDGAVDLLGLYDDAVAAVRPRA